MAAALIPPPLSLYVHLPWCVRKCPYCDFNSHTAPDQIPEQRYVDALLADLQHDLPQVWGRRLISIFIGGGTPSLFSPESLDRLLSGVRALLPLAPDAEITMEANPGTLEYAPLDEYRATGINRLSFGVQSFDDEMLKAIGRIHDADEARNALHKASDAGFDNINIDLMYALPGQDVAGALADVDAALEFASSHLSHYQLTIEPNTLFSAKPPVLPDSEVAWTMQRECQQRIDAAGFDHYEVSAYAQGPMRSRHNVNYWQFGDYLGIGAGAHGKISDGASGTVTRLWKQRHPRSYLEQAGTARVIGDERQLSTDDLLFEYVLNALRMHDGFLIRDFEARTGLGFNADAEPWSKAVGQDLLEYDAERVRPSELGRRFLNDLTTVFLADAN